MRSVICSVVKNDRFLLIVTAIVVVICYGLAYEPTIKYFESRFSSVESKLDTTVVRASVASSRDEVSLLRTNSVRLAFYSGSSDSPEILGVCTGTLVASDVILTAHHCFEGAEGVFQVLVGKEEVGIVSVDVDATDHALIKVDRPLTARPTKLICVPNDYDFEVVFFGSPRAAYRVERKGRVVSLNPHPTKDASAGYILFDAPVWPGDSGAGLATSDGSVFGVVLGYTDFDEKPPHRGYGLSSGLSFSKAQYGAYGLTRDCSSSDYPG